MKIVLKELMNRVGLPTDNLICALTTYMGFGGSARAVLDRVRSPQQRWQAEGRLCNSPHVVISLKPTSQQGF